MIRSSAAVRRSKLTTRAWRRVVALPGVLTTRDWVMAVALSLGMTSLAVAVGILPDLAAEGWGGNPRLPWLVGSGAFAAVGLSAGVVLWWVRRAVLKRHGTASVLQESAPAWDREDSRSFLAAVESQFEAVRAIPGPGDLVDGQAWRFGEAGRHWDARVDILVNAFRAVRSNDNPASSTALYLWAPWSVAFAFGFRATSGRRGVNLQIRQRPSDGRLGRIEPVGFAHTGHTFLNPGELSRPAVCRDHAVRLRTGPPKLFGRERRTSPVTVLLVRTSDKVYGPLAAGASDAVRTLAIEDAGGLGLPRHAAVNLHEWHYRPPGGSIEWDDYPAVAAAAAVWIRDRAEAARGSIVLLGALVPQEIGAGIGIVAARLPSWPARLWPLMFDAERRRLTTVNLNLGRAVKGSVPQG